MSFFANKSIHLPISFMKWKAKSSQISRIGKSKLTVKNLFLFTTEISHICEMDKSILELYKINNSDKVTSL